MRRTKFRYELDGVILGAAAGMAFAGFEDLVYALSALNENGLSNQAQYSRRVRRRRRGFQPRRSV